MISGKFLCPSYYKDFKCKMGECRTCCCGGWGVTVNQMEYYRLLSLDCSKELRDRLDYSVSILNDATPERYAVINQSYLGDCMLRRQDGLCALQCEMGEEEIPTVCRYYPRSPRLFPSLQCSISNSCEKVIEEMIESDDPLGFEELDLSFHFDDDETTDSYPKEAIELSKKSLGIIQDRSLSIIDRIHKISDTISNEDISFIHSINYAGFLMKSIKRIYARSHSIGDYIESIDENKAYDLECNYKELKTKFNKIDIYLEKILTNHLFYIKYPYTEYMLNKKEAGIYINSLFTFYVILLNINLKDANVIDFVDLTGKFFRVAEHTAIYKNFNYIYEMYIEENNMIH